MSDSGNGATIPGWVFKIIPLVVGTFALAASYLTTQSLAQSAKDKATANERKFEMLDREYSEKFDEIGDQYHELDKSMLELRGALNVFTEQQRAFTKALEDFKKNSQ